MTIAESASPRTALYKDKVGIRIDGEQLAKESRAYR